MREIVEKYRKWKLEHPEEDYYYGEVHNFVDTLTGDELLSIFEFLELHFPNREWSKPNYDQARKKLVRYKIEE